MPYIIKITMQLAVMVIALMAGSAAGQPSQSGVGFSYHQLTLISNPTPDISLYGYTDTAYHRNIYPKIFLESFVPYETVSSRVFNESQLVDIQRSVLQTLQQSFELASGSGLNVAKLSIAITAAKYENNIPVTLYPLSKIWSGSDDVGLIVEVKLKDSQSDNTLGMVNYRVSGNLLRSKITTAAQLTMLVSQLASNATRVVTGLPPNKLDLKGILPNNCKKSAGC
jgi:hypothetical protein